MKCNKCGAELPGLLDSFAEAFGLNPDRFTCKECQED